MKGKSVTFAIEDLIYLGLGATMNFAAYPIINKVTESKDGSFAEKIQKYSTYMHFYEGYHFWGMHLFWWIIWVAMLI